MTPDRETRGTEEERHGSTDENVQADASSEQSREECQDKHGYAECQFQIAIRQSIH